MRWLIICFFFSLIFLCDLDTVAQDTPQLKTRYLKEARLFRQDPPKFLTQWDSIAATVDSVNDPAEYAWAHYAIGIIQGQYFQKMEEAGKEMKKAVWGYEQAGDSVSVGKTQGFIGSSLFFQGKWEEAQVHFKLADEILSQTSDSFNLARVLMSYGALEKKRGDLGSAIDILSRGASLAEGLGNQRLSSNIEVNLGACYSELGQLEKAYTTYAHALEGFVSINDKRGEGICWLNQGRIRYKQKRFVEAENLLLPASRQLREIGQKTFLVTALMNLAYVYRETREWDGAETAFAEAYQLAKATDGKGTLHIITRELGRMAYQKGDLRVAHDSLQSALRWATKEAERGPFFPTADQVTMTFETIHTTHYLGRTLKSLFDKEAESSWLEKSLQSYRLSMDLIDSLRLSQNHRESQAHLAEINESVFSEALYNLYTMYLRTQSAHLLEEMWRTAERSRSFQLFQAMNKLAEDQRPEWITQAYASIPIEDIGSQLLPGEYMLQFVSGKRSDRSDVFGMMLSRAGLEVKVLGDQSVIHARIDSFRSAITDYWKSYQTCLKNPAQCDTSQAEAYVRLGRALYKTIWDPFFKENDPASFPLRTIVIPNERLAMLPFGALLTEDVATQGPYRTYPYLVQKFEIQQAYSAQIWWQQHTRNTSYGAESSLAFAPFVGDNPAYLATRSYEDRASSWAPLPYSEKEVRNLVENWDVNFHMGKDATSDKVWLEEAYQILHFSSHAKAHVSSPEQSYIAMADTFLSLAEIQSKVLPVDMVVLSACETGLGQYQKGEGVLSLGRAFHEAGAQSSLTSLWQVEDIATSQIIDAFYQNLKKGMDKTQALQIAQLDYIQSVPNMQAHPFFWSAWNMMGDERPIKPKGSSNWWYWVIGVLVLGGGFLWGRSRRK